MTMPAVELRVTCRSCGVPDLEPVVTLGDQNVVDFVADPTKLRKPKAPLDLVICDNCKLVQLSHTVNPEFLYEEFWYRSGINESMRAALKDVTIQAASRVPLQPGDALLDIGCNDGTMLSLYPDANQYLKVGIDPCNIAGMEESKQRMDIVVKDFFNKESALTLLMAAKKKFKIVTAIAMFYDLEDPAEFLNAVKVVMDDEGIFVVQMNYLLTMLKNCAFDNICHEHLTYFSLHSLLWLTNRCGFQPIDVEVNEVNGGSFRVTFAKNSMSADGLQKAGYVAGSRRIEALLQKEKNLGLTQKETYRQFGTRCKSITAHLSRMLVKLVTEGKIIYAYGASTRGTVLLQTIASAGVLAGAAERDPRKFGLYMVGGFLKILPEEEIRPRTKYFLLLPWHFLDSVLEREKEWGKAGGKFIVPLPKPRMYGWSDAQDGWVEESL